MVKKKALKGLKRGYIHPVTENSETSYKTDAAKRLLALQNLTKEDEREEFEIPADDEIYATGSEYKYTTLEVTVAEMGNEQESFLTGGDFVSEGNIYRAKSTDTAPEVALAYATKMIDSGYRLFRHPVCKVMSIKVEHKTAGDGTEVAAYVLTLRNTARKIDGLYREQKDVETEDFSWIETVEQLPIPAGP